MDTMKAEQTGPPRIRFTDVTAESGIDFVHQTGAFGEKWMPESLASGCMVFDYDQDGLSDVLFLNGTFWPGHKGEGGAPTPRLYRNKGGMRFEDVTEQAGLNVAVYGMGGTAGDYDGDGDPDLYLTSVGDNLLLRNDGGRFVDVTINAGVGGGAWETDDGRREPEWSTSAAWVDVDSDGWIDLFVGNYVQWSPETDLFASIDGENKSYATPQEYRGLSARLYRNLGNGRFEDVTEASGVYNPDGKTMGVAVSDYDSDGDPDIFVTNDTQPNFLYKNAGNGTFEDVAKTAGTLAISAGMSAAMGDYDNDGRLDLYVSSIRSNQRWFSQDFNVRGYVMNLVQSGRRAGLQGTFLDLRQHLGDDWARVGQHELAGNYLLRNLGNGEFADHSEASGTRLNGWYWGSGFLDLDNDGWLDIYAVNGWISGKRSHDLCLDFARIGLDSKKRQAENWIYTDDFVADNSWNGREHNHFFRNLGNGRFMEMGVALGLDGTADARGFAASDFDHDGDIDLVVNNYNAPAYYYVNHWNQEGNWLAVSLRGTKTNRDGVGSEITMHIGDRPQHRLVSAGHAYTGQFSLEQIFGMGQTVTAEVQVRWPDGSVEDFGPHKADQRIVLTEGEGRSIIPPPPRFDASANTQPGGQHLWTRLLPLVALAGLTLIFTLWKKTKPKRKSKI